MDQKPFRQRTIDEFLDDLGSSAYRAYSDQRANAYRSMADDLTSSPIFQGMDDETRDKVLKAAYDLARAQSDRQTLYLAQYVTPTIAVEAEYPQRLKILGLVGGFLMLTWLIGVMTYYSIRDRR